MKKRKYKLQSKTSKVSDDVMKNGLLIGCHHGLKKNEIFYMFKIFDKFLNQKSW